MEKIKAAFEARFIAFDIPLPAKEPSKGVIRKAGWDIQYRWGEERGQVFFEFISDHRMCLDDLPLRIWQDGREESFDGLSKLISADPTQAAHQAEQDREIEQSRSKKGFV